MPAKEYAKLIKISEVAAKRGVQTMFLNIFNMCGIFFNEEVGEIMKFSLILQSEKN